MLNKSPLQKIQTKPAVLQGFYPCILTMLKPVSKKY